MVRVKKSEWEEKPIYEEIDLENLNYFKKEYKIEDEIGMIINNSNDDHKTDKIFLDLVKYSPCNSKYFEQKIDKLQASKRLNEQFYFLDYAIHRLKLIELIQKAFNLTINQLNDLRYQNFEFTHAKAHSISFLIVKLLRNLENLCHPRSEFSIIMKSLEDKLIKLSESIQESYSNIHKTLIDAGIVKRDKLLLLRAFYDEFAKNKNVVYFRKHNFRIHYYAIYDFILDQLNMEGDPQFSRKEEIEKEELEEPEDINIVEKDE